MIGPVQTPTYVTPPSSTKASEAQLSETNYYAEASHQAQSVADTSESRQDISERIREGRQKSLEYYRMRIESAEASAQKDKERVELFRTQITETRDQLASANDPELAFRLGERLDFFQGGLTESLGRLEAFESSWPAERARLEVLIENIEATLPSLEARLA